MDTGTVILTNHKINEAIEMEESYIWTNDSLFLNQLYMILGFQSHQSKNESFKFIMSILISYYETIKYTRQNYYDISN